MKNILLIAPTSSTMCSPIRRAFEHHGFKVSLVDYRGNFVLNPENIIHSFVKNLPPRMFVFLKRRAKRLVTRQILAKSRKIKPDCVFVVKGPALFIDMLASLRKTCPLVNYYPETMDQWDLIKKIAPCYDYFVDHDPYVVEMLKKEFPQVVLITNKDNLGFGKANNQALKIAQGDYLMFLNTDVVVLKFS